VIAAIYARKSTEQNGVGDQAKSVTRQIEHATAYAVRKGWAVDPAHVYADDGISGADFTTRPGFLRLMNALKPRPPFQVLIMSEESRLGREQIETAYALKQLTQAGVRVFLYLEDRERTIDSPTEKLLMSVAGFADELEREKARQRTRDAMLRLAQARHVTGGKVYGYRNEPVLGLDGTRQHVLRVVDPEQAPVVERIFRLCAEGNGITRIAKTLNAEGIQPPRRAQGWAPSAIREILLRETYRGVVTWGKVRKRDQWGLKTYRARPESEWVRHDVPELRLVSDALWQAAHTRMQRARDTYVRGPKGQLMARPALRDLDTPYLLSGIARCSACGGPLASITRDFKRQGRRRYYGCDYAARRGHTVCRNRLLIRQEALDQAVLAALGEVLEAPILERAVERTLERVRAAQAGDVGRRVALERELAAVEASMANLTDAVKRGRATDALLEQLEAEHAAREGLRAQLGLFEQRAALAGQDRHQLVTDLRARVGDLGGLLGRHVTQTRQILRKLLVGRLACEAFDDGRRRGYRFTGTVTYERLLPAEASRAYVVTPAGFEPAISTLKGSRPWPG
jgi:site-specific DNA recombinase